MKGVRLGSFSYLGPERHMHVFEGVLGPLPSFHPAKLKQFYASFYFDIKAGKTLQTQNPTVRPHGVAPAAYVAQGFDPPRTVSPVWESKTRRRGWADVRGNGGDGGLPFYTCPHLLPHPVLVSDFLPLGFFIAIWDAAVTEDTCAPPPPTSSLKMFSHFCSSVWGAAVGGAGRGSHGHARGAGGSYRLPDVRHEEGVAGQLVHVDAVLLSVH